MRKTIIIILVVIIPFLLLIYYGKYSDWAEKRELNAVNITKLQEGVTLKKALQIMGKPDNVRKHANYPEITAYFYTPPFGTSDGIYFMVDSTNTVIEIIP